MSLMLAAEQVSPERLRPLRRAEYERLVDLGAFAEERIELLRGALVAMSPQKAPHAHAVSWLSDWLTRSLGDRALVRCQCPLAILDDSEPEPDLVVVPRLSFQVCYMPSSPARLVLAHPKSLSENSMSPAPSSASAPPGRGWCASRPSTRRGTRRATESWP